MRTGTHAQWSAANSILALDEPGYVTDKRLLFIGDGVTAYLSVTGFVDMSVLAAFDFDPPDFTPGYVSGQYYLCNSPAAVGTASNVLVNNTVRVTRWIVTETVVLSKLWFGFTIVGESGSTFRPGIWADDGHGKPGSLIVDAGAVSTTGTVGAIEATVSVTLTPGVYWVGGAVQGAATTQPTLQVVNSVSVQFAPMQLGTSLPASSSSYIGWSQASVTGAFSTFTTSPVLSTLAARIGYKVA